MIHSDAPLVGRRKGEMKYTARTRYCRIRECGKLLSHYNPYDECLAHNVRPDKVRLVEIDWKNVLDRRLPELRPREQ